MDTRDHLARLLGIESSKWMMCPSERLAVIGLLATIKPKHVLELGCADAGLTHWLSEYSEDVVTVDIDPKVLTVTQPFPNVLPLCMTTTAAAKWIESEHRRFDVGIIDADHSRGGIHRDLKNMLSVCDVILLHDTYYPPCREGILEALAGRDIYYNLELVPGGLQPDGMWGGLGIVVPLLPRQEQSFITPRLSTYAMLRQVWRMRECAKTAKRSLGNLRRQMGRAKRAVAGTRPINRTL